MKAAASLDQNAGEVEGRDEIGRMYAAPYPRVDAYLAALPAGIESYPECRVKSETLRDLLERLILADVQQSPIDLATLACNETVWLPEVQANTLLLLGRDTIFASDAAFMAWSRENMLRLWSRPTYRLLMYLAPPEEAALGAAKRWSTFHTGSWLAASPMARRGGRHTITLTLTVPPRLFDAYLLDYLGVVYETVLDSTRANDGKMQVRPLTDTKAEFLASWAA